LTTVIVVRDTGVAGCGENFWGEDRRRGQGLPVPIASTV
jgi:hypothetical protein